MRRLRNRTFWPATPVLLACLALGLALLVPASASSAQGTRGGGGGGGTIGGGALPGLPSGNHGRPPLTLVQIEAGTAVHVEAPDLALRLEPHRGDDYRWNFGRPGAAYNELRGFNAAHLYDASGQYTVHFNGRPMLSVLVRPARAETPVSDAADLARVLENGGVARLPPGVILLDRTLVARPGARVVGDSSGTSTLFWVGQPKRSMIEAFDGDLAVRGVNFDSGYGPEAGRDAPGAIRIGGRGIAVVNCRFGNIDTAVNGNGSPDGVLVQDCGVAGVTDLRGYLVWVEGRRYTILGNSAPNSTRETPVRMAPSGTGPNTSLVLVHGNRLGNVARTEVDPYDTVKNALRAEAVDYCWVESNDFDGIVAAGPLGQGDGVAQAWRRGRFMVFRDNLHRGPVELRHRLENFLMADSRVEYAAGSIGGFGVACLVQAPDSRYGLAPAANLSLQRNVFVSPRDGERMLWVAGPVAGGLELVGNTFGWGREPPLGQRRTVMAFEGGWRQGYASRDNVLPPVGGHGWPDPLAAVQVGGQNDPASYLRVDAWLTLPGVEGDRFGE